MRRTALAALALLTVAACGDNDPDTVGQDSAPKSSAGQELVVLEDDLRLQTVDNIIPVVSKKVASPQLLELLDKVMAALDTEELVGLNRQVDVERQTPARVAEEFVESADLAEGASGGSGKVVVGAANFAENQILANVFERVLDAAGYDASVKPLTNREVYEPALERGEVHVMPEYVGTLTEFLNKKANGPDAPPKASGDLDATVSALKTLAAARGLEIGTPSAAADQNAFAVTKVFAEAHDLEKLSDLKGFEGELVLGGPPECPTRPFCKPGLEEKYGLEFASFVSLDAGGPLTKTALRQGRIQLGLVFSSDGSLSAPQR